MRVRPETKKAMKRRSASKPPRRILTTTQGDVKRRVEYVLAEPVDTGISIRSHWGRKLGLRIAASRFGLALERDAQLRRRPGLRGVRRILQKLSDDRAPNLGVRAALHLRQRRHRILVDNQVIDRPPGGFTRRRSDALLAGDEDPAARISGTNLLAVEQFRMLGNQRLELVSGGKRRLFERLELAVTGRRVDAFGHDAFLARVRWRSDAPGAKPYAGSGDEWKIVASAV